MHRYWEHVIAPILNEIKPKKIVEIGAKDGKNTKKIITYCKENEAFLYSIDPIKSEPVQLLLNEECFEFIQDISLNALYKLHDIDVVLIDGDHNWYTVFNELKLIEKNCGEKFPLILVHDISWPYGRRDLYYNPTLIPSQYLNPYKKAGILYDTPSLSEDGGLNSHLNNCVFENNYRNGVLTAIEDFIEESNLYLNFYSYPVFNGLGVLYTDQHSFSESFFQRMTNKLLYQMEELRNLEILENTEIKKKLTAAKDFKTKQLLKLDNELDRSKNELELLYQEKLELEDCYIKLKSEMQNLKYQVDNNVFELEVSESKYRDLHSRFLMLEEERDALENRNSTISKECLALKNQVALKDNEIRIHLDSIKYRLGEEIIKVYYSPLKMLQLPMRIYRLFKEGKNKKQTKKVKQGVTKESKLDKVDKKIIKPSLINEIAIVICVHNALEDLKLCIESVFSKRTFPFDLIVVDDGSDHNTKKFLEKSSIKYNFTLITNSESMGYTIAANKGIMRAQNAEYIVLLNSDTIVTYKWLEKLKSCMESDPRTGVVGPLSNAASWQSVPKLKEGNDWSLNPLEGYTIEQMSSIITHSSTTSYPSVPLVNGFCYMISRKLIDKIGYLDEKTFPKGYGEEDDYSFRAAEAGFLLKIADNCYIYHHKSKSFTPEGRKQMIVNSKKLLFEKHSKEKVLAAVQELSSNVELENLRTRVQYNLQYRNSTLVSNKIAVYTAIFGDYDELYDPLLVVDGIDYICFTDNKQLKSNIWDIRYLENDQSIDSTRNARKIKILAHKYLPEYEYSIWVDANFKILDNPVILIEKHLSESLLAAYNHSGGRNCIYAEADACIRLNKDDPIIINKQTKVYKDEGYPEFNGLVETGILLRKHNDIKSVEAMEIWWEQIMKYSKRDQISFNYVMWKLNFAYNSIDEYIRDNYCFMWVPHKVKVIG